MLIRLGVLALMASCAFPAAGQVRAFVGATVIDGNGGPPIRNGVVVTDGRTIREGGTEGLGRYQ